MRTLQSLVGVTSMKRERCWVWFRGGLNQKSHWEGGFYATTDEQEGVLIQHGSYRDTRVPAWRVTQKEPLDLHTAPEIPEDAVWKIN